jgi:acyl carrier protein
VRDPAAVAGVVIDLLDGVRAGGVSRAELSDETHLGDEGLGLDSVEIVEVLLGCEERYGAAVGELLEATPLTFGRVVAHFAAAC